MPVLDLGPAADEMSALIAAVPEVAALAGLDELVIHGWDIARASGQELNARPADVAAVHGFLAAAGGPFGPVVAVTAGRPLLDQAIGLAGRDPGWTPGRPGS